MLTWDFSGEPVPLTLSPGDKDSLGSRAPSPRPHRFSPHGAVLLSYRSEKPVLAALSLLGMCRETDQGDSTR